MSDGPDAEELLEVDDIQGNILAGFRKDYQRFLFFVLDRSPVSVAATRSWLRTLVPHVSTVAEVHAFNELFRSMRRRRQRDPHGLVATWLNVAFSAAALTSLTSAEEVAQFADASFRAGMAASASLMNDPLDSTGQPAGWKVGGIGNEADVVVIVASDSPAALSERVAWVHRSIQALSTDSPPLQLIFDQPGQVLAAPLKGHEHFGFKDGVSQPGIRGFVQISPPTYLTQRLFDESVAQGDPRLPEYARPGQPLIWPGQFVFGYRRQSTQDPRQPPAAPNDLMSACPTWGKNGSYLVIRRLRQHVDKFREFVRTAAETLRQNPSFSSVTPALLAAKLVGRWPSGAPLMRSPTADDPALGADAFASNYFQYAQDSPIPMPIHPDFGYAGDHFVLSRADDTGVDCPLSAHVRKVNPRDGLTEQGSNLDVLTRLVVRRGIPFGEPYDQADPASRDDPDHDRGLIFVSYQTSIDNQFMFVQKNWVNDARNPNFGGGVDAIIGQGADDAQRQRATEIVAPDQAVESLSLPTEWVVPTGGGFFFSPSISAMANVLGAAR